MALVGHRVFVGTNDQTQVVNWQTGRAKASTTVPGSQFPDVHGSHAVVQAGRSTRVIDVASGKVLLKVSQRNGFVELSPDGRFATVSGGMGAGVSGAFTVHDLREGTAVRLPASDWGYGWSADGGHVYRVQGSTMTTCRATTGTCHTARVPALSAQSGVRYPGILYES